MRMRNCKKCKDIFYAERKISSGSKVCKKCKKSNRPINITRKWPILTYAEDMLGLNPISPTVIGVEPMVSGEKGIIKLNEV